MAKRTQLTAQLFDDLFIDAMGGDSAAYDAFYDNARKLAKRVNQQMLEAERKGIDSEAFRLARDFLGGKKRFKENVQNMDVDELRAQVDNMLSVRGQADYSIPYAIESQEQIDKIVGSKLFEAAGIDTTDTHVTYNINEFLKSGAFKEYAKTYGGTDIIRAAQDHFAKGGSAGDLIAAYEDYASNKANGDMVQTWHKATGTWL